MDDSLNIHDWYRKRYVVGLIEPGQPCKHPNCANHLSHPCEVCGRYAAGLATGPDVEIARKYIHQLALIDGYVANSLELARQNGWTWEQTLTFMVIEFQRENQELRQKLGEYLSFVPTDLR